MIGGASALSKDEPAQPLLELRSITKRFGRVVACDDVTLTVRPGEIRGLLGQNGAGKSTLMKIASGVVARDAGEIAVRGEVVDISDPLDAAARGIGMVHQHFSLIGPMPVWKNVTLGDRGRVDRDRSITEVERISELYGLQVDPHARVSDLTIGQRQRVEIIKCLRREPDVVILDEPTSVLTMGESRALFDVLRELIREKGRAVVLISHRLEEMLEAADDITILRDGKIVSTIASGDATPNVLAREMLGRVVSLGHEPGLAPGRDARPDKPPAIQLREVRCTGRRGHVELDGLSLSVDTGEILGVAGVEGNGQAALVDMLSNLMRPDSGWVLVDDDEVKPGRGRSLVDAGVGVIPADRHDSGCVLDMTVAENLVMSRIDSVMTRGVIDTRLLFGDAQQHVQEFSIVTSSLSAPLRSLSGGNQQRVVLAREVSSRPRVLVAAEPTHGLDVGAMEYIWTRLREAAEEGTAVLLVSTDLDEILALAHRIVVIYRGRIVGEMAADQVDLEQLGLLMGGQAA